MLYGTNFIGHAGVDSFTRKAKSDGPGRPKSIPIKDFGQFRWKNRRVGVVYDADEKPNVRTAEQRLGALLLGFGARAFYVRLKCECPKPCKGIDDFVVKHGIQAFKALVETPFDQSDLLDQEYILLEKPAGAIYSLRSHELMTSRALELLTADRRTIVFNAEKNSYSEVPAAQVWVQKTARRTQLLFQPSAKPLSFIDDPEFGGQGFNLWRGLAFEPKPGNIEPYLELLQHGTQNDPNIAPLFENWAAAQLQRPGVKIKYAIVTVGNQTGFSKTLLGRTIAALFGYHGLVINEPERLHAKFNSLFEGKVLVVANEIIKSKVEAERLKGLITENELTIEHKGFNAYQTSNHINLYMTTNKKDALKIDNSTRRFLIWSWPDWTSNEKRARFFREYHRWLYLVPDEPDRGVRREAGAALMHHFLTKGLGKYDIHADAPITEAKLEMVAASEDDIEIWVRELDEIGARAKLGLFYHPVMTATQLTNLFIEQGHRPGHKDDVKSMGRAMGKVFKQIVPRSRDRKKSTRLWVLDPKWVESTRDADIYDYWYRLATLPKDQRGLADSFQQRLREAAATEMADVVPISRQPKRGGRAK